MKYIKSQDETPIAYEELGKGPGLIIIGGSLADHHMYQPLALALSERLTVYNYDRRNRGKSGASLIHSVETELDDLKAIIDLNREAPILYGHSAGAALAIRAAALGVNIKKLIISDLPFSPLNDESGGEAEKFEYERQEIIKFLTLGNKSGAVKYFLKDFGMNEQELNAFVASAEGKKAVDLSRTLPIDYALLGNGIVPGNLLRRIRIPTLILTSGYGMTAAQDAANYLSNCKIDVLDDPIYTTSASETARKIMRFIETEQ